MPSETVRWFDWSDDAFRKAQAEDKPIVMDLCAPWSHGCRVMDAQTYGDPEIAELLNRDYVAIRVDCDRRPDINDRFNLGGWPTTAFLTPTGELMGGATFVARDQMKQLLVQLKAGYAANRHRIVEEIARRDEKIREALEPQFSGVAQLTMEVFRKTVRGVVATHDSMYGGFGKAPKFPLVPSLRVALQALHETQGPDFRHLLTKTLDAMADRGLYDHEQGAFFHYATNDTWTMARFEKLAEDNAGLIRLYLDASIVMEADKYRDKALHALAWAKARLLDPDRGVFFGSQRADDDYYGASPQERAKREPPSVDRTVFVPASAAMASTFLRAAQVTGDAGLAAAALRGLEWLLKECVRDGTVAHYHDGSPQVFVLARDPIALASALLDAYDHTGEKKHLDVAETMTEDLLKRFWSDAEKGIVDRAVDALDRGDLSRLKKNLPENAGAAENFARLWRITGEERHKRCAEKILLSYPDFEDSYGHPTAEYALAADWMVRPPEEVEPTPAGLRAFVPRRKVKR
ncbi:MAG: thioredoxin domain-containing protein [Planctomycetes bacterium]|nr:thioredoxin domain-containing protein [Planctomycetota bacterium]